MSTRDKICATALKLFVQSGIGGTTTRAIASACDIAEGTIYRHFTSKDELALDLFTRNWTAFATYMERAAQRGESARERLDHMLSWLLMAAERQPELFDYLFIAAPHLAAQMPPEQPSPLACFKRELADLLPPADLELHLALLMGGLVGVVRAYREGKVSSALLLSPVFLKIFDIQTHNKNNSSVKSGHGLHKINS